MDPTSNSIDHPSRSSPSSLVSMTLRDPTHCSTSANSQKEPAINPPVQNQNQSQITYNNDYVVVSMKVKTMKKLLILSYLEYIDTPAHKKHKTMWAFLHEKSFLRQLPSLSRSKKSHRRRSEIVFLEVHLNEFLSYTKQITKIW
eukprot:TRINITY_DN7305_c0_g1_i1.p1 TRINITY_DN7305_c0_g1~~TRINITY_DN7305_c0_g1_i1.p1  ORF type:complete len:144 (+),score=20.26 TRINITY_DN7305_c0_g1_i1:440-871(+)